MNQSFSLKSFMKLTINLLISVQESLSDPDSPFRLKTAARKLIRPLVASLRGLQFSGLRDRIPAKMPLFCKDSSNFVQETLSSFWWILKPVNYH